MTEAADILRKAKEPSEIIAAYKSAFKALYGDKETPPAIMYSRGWYRVRHAMFAETVRGKEIERRTHNLLARRAIALADSRS